MFPLRSEAGNLVRGVGTQLDQPFYLLLLPQPRGLAQLLVQLPLFGRVFRPHRQDLHLGFWVWDLGFRVEGKDLRLGFGVCGLGFGV